ncbi:Uncharacterised protein [Vibrio cholerae]|uniref:Uncharacterized protein n=1 Tax=Vibrio cholerae TaxID=666 RepID=A0A656B1F6_VIBCL|nr:Uncharacterised protein [Vibrio cholerae]CSA86360.1 Uncharacterised protein [Vibrio cholerae]CSA90981.1 Uncharacterised protein [Vibrio cholerae]CSC03080.1 Uncharacterised protein [Vibrio cholerae]CSC53509.1 Uncharacterised protein [Vibrio cholerae]
MSADLLCQIVRHGIQIMKRMADQIKQRGRHPFRITRQGDWDKIVTHRPFTQGKKRHAMMHHLLLTMLIQQLSPTVTTIGRRHRLKRL